MIKALAICDRGMEPVVKIELDEMLGVKGKGVIEADCCVLFETKNYDDLFNFCYSAQSIERVIILFDNFQFKELDDLITNAQKVVKKIDFSEWFDKDLSFKVECIRLGKHGFGSSEAEKQTGDIIHNAVKKQLGFEPEVNLEQPDIIFHLFVNNNDAYLGIDIVGKNLTKRQYRIFSHAGDVNAAVAYAISRLAGFSKDKTLLDPFCKAGGVCIESAVYANKISINHYSKEFAFKKLKPFKEKNWDDFFKKIDSKATDNQLEIYGYDHILKNIESLKKNSKLAGVSKFIKFSKIEVEWLETKFDEEQIDIIASKIPCQSKHTPEKLIRKIYKELFYQAEFILKKGGVMSLLAEHDNLLKEMMTKEFKVKQEHEIWAGQQKYLLLIVEKN